MEELIHISEAGPTLEGMLKIPEHAQSIILFAHGSGSSRFSPRNNFVATILNEAGFGTLLIDLLSLHEDQTYQTRFDIALLSKRLSTVIKWLTEHPKTKHLSIALFGASTGAAAALEAAAIWGGTIKAVVSRGGRPDLATHLNHVKAPTLLIVGGEDFDVLTLNQAAYAKLTCIKKLEIVPHATHLFEESGALEEVANLSTDWFKKHCKN